MMDELHTVNVKPGDRITFRGIYYHVPGWYDEQPIVFTKPFLLYTEGYWESELEDICINICIDRNFQFEDESLVEKDINWSGKSSKSLKRAINKALKTKEKPYSSVWCEVFECEVEFYEKLQDPNLPFDEFVNPMEMHYKIVKETKV